MRTSVSLLAAVMALGLATARADIPQWCKTLGGEAAANSPSCQEPVGACEQLDTEAIEHRGTWLAARKSTKSTGLRQTANGQGGVSSGVQTTARAKLNRALEHETSAQLGYRGVIARMKHEGCDTPYANDWQDPMLSG